MWFIPPLGESLGDLFIGAVRGSDNNVWTATPMAPFTLSAQSQGYYSHFTPLTTLCWAYYIMTRVIPGRGLGLSTLSRPPTLNHRPTLITVFTIGLCQHGRSWPPLPSSCQVMKQSLVHELVWSPSCLVMPEVPLVLRQGLAHELVSAKLIVLNDAEGAILNTSIHGWHGRSSASVAYSFTYSGIRAILCSSLSGSCIMVICDGY
jgi:hypothetical protein